MVLLACSCDRTIVAHKNEEEGNKYTDYTLYWTCRRLRMWMYIFVCMYVSGYVYVRKRARERYKRRKDREPCAVYDRFILLFRFKLCVTYDCGVSVKKGYIPWPSSRWMLCFAFSTIFLIYRKKKKKWATPTHAHTHTLLSVLKLYRCALSENRKNCTYTTQRYRTKKL